MKKTTDNQQLVALPEIFKDIENWAQRFAHPTEKERYRIRATADFRELELFYQALLPRMPDIFDYLAGHPADGSASAEARRLADLGCAFMDVSLAIEIFKNPVETEGLDWRRIGILF